VISCCLPATSSEGRLLAVSAPLGPFIGTGRWPPLPLVGEDWGLLTHVVVEPMPALIKVCYGLGESTSNWSQAPLPVGCNQGK
jgi:hypothetical protein